MDYTQLVNETLALYMSEKYEESYRLITDESKDIETIDSQVMNFRYAIAARAGMMDVAKRVFKEAIIDKGYWYGFEYLMNNDNLIDLRSDPEITDLIDLCKKREEMAKASSKSELLFINIDDDEPKGTLLALHGNQENARIAAPFYKSAAKEGYTIILPQSSQVDCTDAYTWNDLERGYEELSLHVKTIKVAGDIKLSPLIVSGFSAGGRLILHSVLEKLFKPQHCILLAPWLPEIDNWIDNKNFDGLEGVEFHIIVGSEDEDCLNGSLKLYRHLINKGLQCTITEIEGMAHRIPTDFGDQLTEII